MRRPSGGFLLPTEVVVRGRRNGLAHFERDIHLIGQVDDARISDVRFLIDEYRDWTSVAGDVTRGEGLVPDVKKLPKIKSMLGRCLNVDDAACVARVEPVFAERGRWRSATTRGSWDHTNPGRDGYWLPVIEDREVSVDVVWEIGGCLAGNPVDEWRRRFGYPWEQ